MKPCRRRSAACSVVTSILTFLLLLIPAIAIADGMAFRYRPASSLEPLTVDEQRAVIAHKDGVQRMFIAINLQDPPSAEDPSRAAVWIFPVPGSPDRADVDVTSFIPELRGEDVQQTFKTAMEKLRWIPAATQPHFLPLAFGPMIAGRSVMGMPEGSAKGVPGVTTHKEIEKWGIHAELITADSVDRLSDYLHKKNVGVGEETLKPFTPYLSDKYVLVVAWISSYEAFVSQFPQYKEKRGAKRPALYVEFPTDKPFYPMRPTSGYGRKTMTVSLYLVGWLNLDMSSWASSEKGAMRPYIRYYAAERKAFDEQYRTFLYSLVRNAAIGDSNTSAGDQRKTADKFLSAIPAGDVPFTRVIIRTEAANFTQDFRFSPNSRVSVMHFLGTSLWTPVLAVLFMLVIPSYLSGGISGKLVFGEWKPWARTGLWNCLTIVALVIAAWLKRRGSASESKRTTVSGRWDACVLGILMCIPANAMIGFISVRDNSWKHGSALSALFWGLVVVEILIASWIVTKSISDPPPGKEPNREGKRVLIGPAMRESVIRVSLMCVPVVLSVTLLSHRIGTLRLNFGELWWLNAVAWAASFVLVAAIVSVLLSVLINFALIIVSRVAKKAASARSSRPDPQSGGEVSGFPSRKSEALLLGALTCIPAAFLVPVHLLDASWSSTGIFPVVASGLITIELLIATWVVWKEASAPMATDARLSPGWPVAIAVLPLLLPVLWVLIRFITNVEFRLLTLANYSAAYHRVSPEVVYFTALTVIGLVLIGGFLNRKRLWLAIHVMSYRNAFSTMILIMGVLFYLGVAVPIMHLFSSGLTINWLAVGYGLAIFALLLGAWLVKGLLNSGATKALRFGVVFSVVFGLLNLAIFVLLAWLGSSWV